MDFKDYKKLIKDEVNSLFGFWEDFMLDNISSRDVTFCERQIFYKTRQLNISIYGILRNYVNAEIHQLKVDKGCKLYK